MPDAKNIWRKVQISLWAACSLYSAGSSNHATYTKAGAKEGNIYLLYFLTSCHIKMNLRWMYWLCSWMAKTQPGFRFKGDSVQTLPVNEARKDSTGISEPFKARLVRWNRFCLFLIWLNTKEMACCWFQNHILAFRITYIKQKATEKLSS